MPEHPSRTLSHAAPADATTRSGGRLASVLVRDQQCRWQTGEPVPVESYLLQHPELRGDGEALLDLICSEWALREQIGETLSLDEYVRRFPELESGLRMQWEVHVVCRALRRESSQKTFSADSTPETLPARSGAPLPDVPGYEMADVLGHGGMGIVYKARHRGLDRMVALKMLRAAATANSDELARFQTEAAAVARLQHPNIVQIHDVGSWQPPDGGPSVPYLSLELVDGGSLATRLANSPQPPRMAAALVEILARAMESAHRQQIIHRDLKPANVLIADCGLRIADCNSVESAIRNPQSAIKITDFGLAKRLDADGGQTRTHAVMGTPSYMAPEQAEGRAKDVTPATDVYALGAILYEALTGRPPFKGTSVLDTLEQVKMLDPVVPRRLQPGVPRDLETICLKCLAKNPADRYPSARALGDDLRRYLDGKPILARPTPAWEHVWKAAKRRPGISLLLALVFLITLGGFLGILDQWRRAERNADERWHMAYTLGINLVQQAIGHNDTPRAQDLLESLNPGPGRADLRGFEWHYLNGLCHGDAFALDGYDCAAISPDGQFLATGGDQGVIRIWNREAREIATLKGHAAAVTALVLSQDGKLLISAAKDHAVKIWNWRTAEQVPLPDEQVKGPLALATTTDGRFAASGGTDGAIIVWDLVRGKKQLSLRSPQGSILSLTFHPNGRTLAARTTAEKVWVWDLQKIDAEPRNLNLAGVGLESGLAYSPDGRYLATAIGQKTIRLWNAATLERVYDIKGHSAGIGALAFASSARLVSGGWDRTVRIWELSSLPDRVPLPRILRGNRGFITSVSVDRSGQHVVTAGMDHTARLWNLNTPPSEESMATGSLAVHCLAYSPDGNLLATGGPDNTLRIHDRVACSVVELAGHTGWINAVSFRPGRQELATGDENGMVLIWDVPRQQIVHTLRGHAKAIDSLAFSPDGVLLASCSEDGSVRLWAADTGHEVSSFPGHEGPVRAVAFSPDGRRLVTAGADRTVRLWDAGRRTELLRMCGHTDEVLAVAFDATGQRLATGSKDRTIVVWDAATGQQKFVLAGHDGAVAAIVFDPTDSRRLATADSTNGVVKLWDLDTGQDLLTLPGCTGETTCLAFHPDGKELAAGGGLPRQGQIKLWRAAPAAVHAH